VKQAVDPLTEIGLLRDISFLPIVYPSQLSGFESFAYNFYSKDKVEKKLKKLKKLRN
jgi:hypothetical protein